MKKLILVVILICSFIFILPAEAEGQRRGNSGKSYSLNSHSEITIAPGGLNNCGSRRDGCYLNSSGGKIFIDRNRGN
jgi:hypothetical protein